MLSVRANGSEAVAFEQSALIVNDVHFGCLSGIFLESFWGLESISGLSENLLLRVN